MPDWNTDGADWPHRAASRFVEAAGLRWHVQVLGTGPTLLLLHGTGLGSHSFADLADRLASRFTLVVPDLPGHAFTSAPADPAGLALDAMATGVRALLDSLGIAPALVIGHSAGAALGAKLVCEGLPARGLVGLNPAILLRPDPRALPFWGALEWLGTRPLLVDAATLYCADPARFAFFMRRAAPRLPEAALARHHAMFRRREQHVTAFGMMARWDVRPVLEAIAHCPVPALLVAGERDPWFPPRVLQLLAPRFPAAEVVVIPGTGHLSHEEDPDLVASRILTFAARILP